MHRETTLREDLQIERSKDRRAIYMGGIAAVIAAMAAILGLFI